jgi:hypothetical protein
MSAVAVHACDVDRTEDQDVTVGTVGDDQGEFAIEPPVMCDGPTAPAERIRPAMCVKPDAATCLVIEPSLCFEWASWLNHNLRTSQTASMTLQESASRAKTSCSNCVATRNLNCGRRSSIAIESRAERARKRSHTNQCGLRASRLSDICTRPAHRATPASVVGASGQTCTRT